MQNFSENKSAKFDISAQEQTLSNGQSSEAVNVLQASDDVMRDSNYQMVR